jgi:hypothetical protein
VASNICLFGPIGETAAQVNTRIIDRRLRQAGWVIVPERYGASITDAAAEPFDAMWESIEKKDIHVHESLISLLERLEAKLVRKFIQMAGAWVGAEWKARKDDTTPAVTVKDAISEATEEIKALFDSVHSAAHQFELVNDGKKDKLIFLEMRLLEEDVLEGILSLIKGWK